MSRNLINFLSQLAVSPEKFAHYQKNPDEALKEAGLDPDECEALKSRDPIKVSARLSGQSAAAQPTAECAPSQPNVEFCAQVPIAWTAYPQPAHSVCAVYAQPAHSVCAVYPQPAHSVCAAYPQPAHSVCAVYAQPAHSVCAVYPQPAHSVCAVCSQPIPAVCVLWPQSWIVCVVQPQGSALHGASQVTQAPAPPERSGQASTQSPSSESGSGPTA